MSVLIQTISAALIYTTLYCCFILCLYYKVGLIDRMHFFLQQLYIIIFVFSSWAPSYLSSSYINNYSCWFLYCKWLHSGKGEKSEPWVIFLQVMICSASRGRNWNDALQAHGLFFAFTVSWAVDSSLVSCTLLEGDKVRWWCKKKADGEAEKKSTKKSVQGRCAVRLWIFWVSQQNWNHNHAALIKPHSSTRM